MIHVFVNLGKAHRGREREIVTKEIKSNNEKCTENAQTQNK